MTIGDAIAIASVALSVAGYSAWCRWLEYKSRLLRKPEVK